MTESQPSPIACRMDALTQVERTRRSEVLALLRFELAVEADGGPVRLSLGGREGVAAFLRETFRSSATRSGTS